MQETDLDKGQRLIGELLEVIDTLPMSWRDFVGDELAVEINEYLQKKE